jgi:hypothetical protein
MGDSLKAERLGTSSGTHQQMGSFRNAPSPTSGSRVIKTYTIGRRRDPKLSLVIVFRCARSRTVFRFVRLQWLRLLGRTAASRPRLTFHSECPHPIFRNSREIARSSTGQSKDIPITKRFGAGCGEHIAVPALRIQKCFSVGIVSCHHRFALNFHQKSESTLLRCVKTARKDPLLC